MTPEQYQQLQETIKETVENAVRATVNGKIDRMNTKLDTYIKEDNEWKEQAQPTIEMGNNVRGFGKVTVYLLGVAAALFAVLKYFNK